MARLDTIQNQLPMCLIKRRKVFDEHVYQCWEGEHVNAVRYRLIELAIHIWHSLINALHGFFCLFRICNPGRVATVGVAEDIVPARYEPLDWVTCSEK